MVKVSVATLKAELSRYLEMVENGQQVLITSHGREIAKMGPVQSNHVSPINWIEFLKENPPIKTKRKGESIVSLLNSIRDDS